MKKSGLVSVVIPAYNSELTIERAIQSAANQTYKHIEIIVVDDGSVDSTAFIINKIELPVKYLRQDNAGAASARNAGVKLAQGEYIAFLDADDIWHKEKLNIQITAFILYPDLSLCSTSIIASNPSDYKKLCNTSIGNSKPRIINDFRTIFSNPYLGTPSVIIKKKTYLEVGGMDPTLKTAEDVDLWLRVAYKNKIAIIPAPLTIVINTLGSLTDRENVNTFTDNIRVLDKFCEENTLFLKQNKRLVNQVKSTIYTNLGSALLTMKKEDESIDSLRLAFKHEITLRPIYLFLKAVFLIGKKRCSQFILKH